MVKEGGKDGIIWSVGLSKLDWGVDESSVGDWCWHVNNKILESSSGNVVIEEGAEDCIIWAVSLSELDWLVDESSICDWCWHVDNKILESSSSNVVVEESRKDLIILVFNCLIELDKLSGDWSFSVGNKVNECLLGDVFSVKLSNSNLSKILARSAWGSLVKVNIAIIIWESLVEGLRE